MRPLPYDAHIHTSLSDGQDAPADCLRAAEACGLRAVAFADLYDFQESQIPERLQLLARLAQDSQVHLVPAVEAEIVDVTGHLTIPTAVAEKFKLVMVHLSSQTQGIGREVPVRIDRLIDNIFESLVNTIRREEVNVLAHPLNLGRFPAPLTPGQLPVSGLRELARLMYEQEVAFELSNRAWWWYPQLSVEQFTEEASGVVRIFSQEGVKFIVGSDARCAVGVGNMRYVRRLMEQSGVELSQLVDLSRV